jgi:flagellar basal body-associated protein FliL
MVDNRVNEEKDGLKKELSTEGENPQEANAQGTRENEEKNYVQENPDEAVQKTRMGTGEYLVIGLSVLLILIVIGGGMFIWAHYESPDRGQDVALELSKAPQYLLKPFFVPLRPTAGSEKFLRVNISLELTNTHAKRFVKHNEKVRGAIVQILLTAVPKDLEYSHGKKALMDKMVMAINRVLGKDLVSGLRFADVVIL